MTKELAIVTGAPGWLGTRLVDCLLNGLSDIPALASPQARKVRVIAQPGVNASSFDKLAGADSITTLRADVQDVEALAAAFSGAQGATVFHVAGVIHPTKGVKEFQAVNVEGTRNVIEQAIKAGAKRFVHVSSNSPIGCNSSSSDLFTESSPYNPYLGYGQSKKEAEDIVNSQFQQGNIETVIIRPPWFYGPGQPPRQTLFFTMIKNGKGPIVGSGNNLRSMAYIDNICQGLLLCQSVQEAAGKTYWIADKKPYSMKHIIDTVERLLELEFKMTVAHSRMWLPGIASEVAFLVDTALQKGGLYQQKIHVLSEMNKNIACSIETAERELGYKPKVALEEGMRRSIRWVLDQGWTI